MFNAPTDPLCSNLVTITGPQHSFLLTSSYVARSQRPPVQLKSCCVADGMNTVNGARSKFSLFLHVRGHFDADLRVQAQAILLIFKNFVVSCLLAPFWIDLSLSR